MNRDIRFRFWLGHIKKMTFDHSIKEIRNFDWVYTDDVIPLQFTGLQDAQINGNEVYESDIIENCDTKELEIVYWNEDKAAWYCSYVSDPKRIVSLSDSIGNLNKVIGNIYEDSDLIKEFIIFKTK